MKFLIPFPDRMIRSMAALLGAILMAMTPAPAQADAVVEDCSEAGLRAALAAGGRITFACSDAITISNTLVVAIDTVLDASDYEVTLVGASNTNGLIPGLRLFTVNPGVRLQLLNLTLAGGRSTNGGAIAIGTGSELFLFNCVLSNNIALGPDGAAGSNGNNSSSGTGANGRAGTNGVSALGGAIYSLGTVHISDCTFVTNRTFGGLGGGGGNGGNGAAAGGNGGNGGNGAAALGGSIYSTGPLFITNSSFSDGFCSGGDGGAGGTNGSGPLHSDLGNGGAGGAASGGAIYSLGSSIIVGTTFSDNTTFSGISIAAGSNPSTGTAGKNGPDSLGGALCNWGTNSVINCTFSANGALGGNGGNGGSSGGTGGNGGNGGNAWGGSYFNGARAGITNCTFADGFAEGGTNGAAGSGAFAGSAGRPGLSHGGNIATSNGVCRILNSIVAYSVSGSNGFGGFIDLGYNLSSDRTPFTNRASLLATNPLLGNLQDNGGSTLTFELFPNSPAFDAGDPTFCLAEDQRGVTRTYGLRCDIGAFELEKYRINGRIVGNTARPLANVAVTTGTNDAVLTDTNGNYALFVDPGTYDVEPLLDGFLFVPATRTVTVANPGNDGSHVDFTAFPTFTLAGVIRYGSAGVPGVEVSIGSKSVLTDTEGVYVFSGLPGGVYTVQPFLDGYVFTPPLPSVTVRSNVFNQNFTARGLFSVSGTIANGDAAGVEGVTVSDGVNTALTDANGNYLLLGVAPGNLTLTPSKTGHTFDPSTQDLSIFSSLADVNFTATQVYTLRGRVTLGGVGLAGVTLASEAGTTMTEANGSYLLAGFPDGTALTLIPSKVGYRFTPSALEVTIDGDTTNEDFTAVAVLTLAGRITDGGAPLAGVSVRIGLETTVQTDTNGFYFADGLPATNYDVVPTKPGYTFTPGVTNLHLGPTSAPAVNFLANGIYSVRGRITRLGAGLPNVAVTIGTRTALSDAGGNYAVSNLGPGQVTATPRLSGFEFEPAFTNLNLSASLTNVNFQSVSLFSISGRILNGTNPAVGVTVQAGTKSGVTDTAGNYTIARVHAGTNAVTPISSDFLFNPAQSQVILDTNLAGINFAATPVYRISGRVSEGTRSVVGALVQIDNGSVLTDAGGVYVFTNLLAATYTVSVSYSNYTFQPSSQTLSVGPFSRTGINFGAVFTLQGIVTDGGTGIPGVTVRTGTNLVVTATDGLFALGPFAVGTYVVTPSLSNATFQPTSATVALNSTPTNISFVRVYSIGGRVTSDGSNGVAGVDVFTSSGVTNRTDTNGTFLLNGLISGAYVVRAMASAAAYTPTSTNVAVGPSVTNLLFTQVPAYTLSGVVTLDGSGLSGVTVELMDAAMVLFAQSAATDTNGTFTLTNIPAGTFALRARLTGYEFSPATNALIVTTNLTGLNFTAARAYEIAGRILAAGTGLTGVQITAIGIGDTGSTTSDSSGNYSIRELQAGTFIVAPSLSGYGFSPAQRIISIAPSATNVSFNAGPLPTLGGRVTDGSNGIAGITLSLGSQTNLTDAEGSYFFASLPPASYTVTPSGAGYLFTPTNLIVSVGAGSATVNADIIALPLQVALAMRASTNEISYFALPNMTFVLQTSSNLVQWQSVSTNVSQSAGPSRFQDPGNASLQRFYRVIVP